ncbi:MAG: hypothetical protein IMZ62_16020 [Chloroflexi bacterium]|nr:hypothetical protein [Chloroflexota bacterium]
METLREIELMEDKMRAADMLKKLCAVVDGTLAAVERIKERYETEEA